MIQFPEVLSNLLHSATAQQKAMQDSATIQVTTNYWNLMAMAVVRLDSVNTRVSGGLQIY